MSVRQKSKADAGYVARLVADAPKLTDEQRERLRALLRPAWGKAPVA